jgi:HD-GYP domain-containing protein (c-di-GMP phosphodiesterase class II)
MKRITPNYVKPGLVLGQNVYDGYGNLILPLGTELNSKHQNMMVQSGVPEIFIEDLNTADIIVAPLFSPHMEGRLAREYRQLIDDTREQKSLNKTKIEQLCVIVNTIARDLTLQTIGEINVSFSIPVNDAVYLQPVKSTLLCLAIGHMIGISGTELAQLGTASLFKDIGYLFFPIEKVNAAILNDSIDTTLKEHVLLGHKIINQIKLTTGVIGEIVLQHHERWDGKGYPRSLPGEKIVRLAQIISLIDCFTNLLTERPDRERCMAHQAVEYVMAYSGENFSPDIVQSFIKYTPCYASGLNVLLNTGEIGIVSDPNLGFVARPIVRIYHNSEKGDLEETYEVDLSKSKNQTKLITKVLEYD